VDIKGYKKRDKLKEKVKRLEGDVSVVGQHVDNFTFQVGTSQALLSHSVQNEWVVDFGCTHHMDKDASLFTSLDKCVEINIYIVDEFSLDIIGRGDVHFRHGNIVDVYHVSNINENLLMDSQLTHTCKIVECWPYRFFVKNLKKSHLIFSRGFLNLKDNLYNFCDMTRLDSELATLISHTDEQS
jgi:hypothetical protein